MSSSLTNMINQLLSLESINSEMDLFTQESFQEQLEVHQQKQQQSNFDPLAFSNMPTLTNTNLVNNITQLLGANVTQGVNQPTQLNPYIQFNQSAQQNPYEQLGQYLQASQMPQNPYEQLGQYLQASQMPQNNYGQFGQYLQHSSILPQLPLSLQFLQPQPTWQSAQMQQSQQVNSLLQLLQGQQLNPIFNNSTNDLMSTFLGQQLGGNPSSNNLFNNNFGNLNMLSQLFQANNPLANILLNNPAFTQPFFDYAIMDQSPFLPDPNFINSQINQSASNGVYHAIDKVLLPFDNTTVTTPESTLADIFAQSGGEADNNNTDFDLLQIALSAAGLTDALDNPDADLTVLAPNDAAFIDLAQQLGSSATTEQAALDDILATLTVLGDGDPLPLLRDILTYHVIPSSRSFESLISDLAPVATLNGQNVSFYPDFGFSTLPINTPTIPTRIFGALLNSLNSQQSTSQQTGQTSSNLSASEALPMLEQLLSLLR